MRYAGTACAALLALSVPQPAQACLYTQAPEAVGQTSGEYFARIMTAAATYVDLVLIEDDGTRAQNEPGTGVITVRTIARFKGSSADRFSLFGGGLTLKPEAEQVFAAPLRHFTSETGRVTPFPYNEELVRLLFPPAAGDRPPPPISSTSCSPPAISAQTGRFYVVMRSADGRLLNRFSSGDGRLPAFAFVPVRLEQDDHWLQAVQMTTVEQAKAPDAQPSLLYLKPGSGPARVEADLRRQGAAIRAAYFRVGERMDEVRPSPTEAAAPWLERAQRLVALRQREGLGDPDHGAAEYLRSRLNPTARYGSGGVYEVAQAFAAAVRASQRGKSAQPVLVALELDGDPARFAGQPLVDRIGPLPRAPSGLAPLVGQSEAEQFAAMQRIERDIWLLNGGGGNRQGTLP